MKWYWWIILAILVGYASSTQGAFYQYGDTYSARQHYLMESAYNKVGLQYHP